MQRYAKGDEAGFTVRDYGEGLLMIKKDGLSGRCLFFTYDEIDPTRLVALLAYKKEGDEAPRHILDAARERRGRYIEAQTGR